MNDWKTAKETLRTLLEEIERKAKNVRWVESTTDHFGNPDLSQNPDFMSEVSQVCYKYDLEQEDLIDTVEKILCYCFGFRDSVLDSDYSETSTSYKCQHCAYTVATVEYLSRLTTSEMAEVEQLLEIPDFHCLLDSDAMEGDDD